jgi:hypothetical protein
LPDALADLLRQKDDVAQFIDIEVLLARRAARVEAKILLEDDLMRRIPALRHDDDDGIVAVREGDPDEFEAGDRRLDAVARYALQAQDRLIDVARQSCEICRKAFGLFHSIDKVSARRVGKGTEVGKEILLGGIRVAREFRLVIDRLAFGNLGGNELKQDSFRSVPRLQACQLHSEPRIASRALNVTCSARPLTCNLHPRSQRRVPHQAQSPFAPDFIFFLSFHP